MTFTDDTREIPLTRGQVAIVDAADYGWLTAFNWCATRNRPDGVWYATRRMVMSEPGYTRPPKQHLMHREIMGFPLAEVDHRNGNDLDNRRENLRDATHAQNLMNRRSGHGLSRFIGVSMDRRRGIWRANIRVGGKQKCLGRFDTETDAALARDEASRRYFGEFASLNFPHQK